MIVIILLKACSEIVMPKLLTVQEVLLEDNTETETVCSPLTRRTPVAEDIVWIGAFVVCGIIELPPCPEVKMATCFQLPWTHWS